MDIDPDYFTRPSSLDDGIKDIAAGVIESWFRDLDSIETAVRAGRPKRYWSVTLQGHECLRLNGALARVRSGREWFALGGPFWGWSAALDYEDSTCAAIVARYESRAGEIEQRLVAMMER